MSRLSLVSCFVAGVLTLAAGERSFGQTADTPPYVPGELLVGFANDRDRDQVVNQLGATKERLRARGEPPATMALERRSGSALLLKIELPENVKSRLGGDPADELSVLQDFARQLKAGDSRIRYAHPNWIVMITPPPAGGPKP